MTPEQVKDLIERAGLADVMSVFSSAIEIDGHELRPDGLLYDGYSALSTLLTFYGAACAAEMRERAAMVVDGWYSAKGTDDVLAATIRALAASDSDIP